MDPIEEIFTAMHVESALYSRLEARAPWGIDFSASKLVRFGLVVSGSAYLKKEDLKEPLALVAGDCFMVNSHTSFQILDNPQSPLLPCETVFAHSEFENLYFIRGSGEVTDIIVGCFSFDEERGAPLISILPDIIHIPANCVHANLLQATLQLIDMETRDEKLGNKLVIRRLADILFVQAVRNYFATLSPHQGWVAAWRDPHLKIALQALHQNLAHDWQVNTLAKLSGMSRAAFARHFKMTVGSSPIEYLTQWRLYRAKCLLGHLELSLSQIAAQIGYDTDSAFSRAFKRETGVTPGQFRKKVL